MTVSMPGNSYEGKLPELTEKEKELSSTLQKHVRKLAEEIGERNLEHYEGLEKSVAYINNEFSSYGYTTEIQEYQAPEGFLGRNWKDIPYHKQIYKNIIAELPGITKPEEIIVIGAHYDSVPLNGCNAANDNASGVAAVLALAKEFATKPQTRTIRFIAFTNEEPPFFWTDCMGSYVYAKACKDKNENIVGMITPETIGYYSDEPNSQDYPPPMGSFYPDKGNFIAFVGNAASSTFVKTCVGAFRNSTNFPSEGAAVPELIPRVGASDHWSFWKMDYPGLMVTDTAPYRYPHYHTPFDDWDKIDYDKTARVVKGLEDVLKKISN